MKKIITYARVSTTEQAEKGYSLAQQKLELENYAKHNNYRTLQHFEEDYSAKTFDRPIFNNLLKYIKKTKVDYIVCTKMDRFSRNMNNTINMIEKLNKHGVQLRFVNGFGEVDNAVPEDKLTQAIAMILPQIENERIALRTTVGMRQAQREGRWMASAPIGYINHIEDGNKRIIPSTKADAIRYGFKLFAKGVLKMETVRKKVNKKYKLDISKQTFEKILKNNVYIGKIKIKAWRDEPAEVVQGLHIPLISDKVFYRVQNIIKGRSVDRTKKNTRKPQLPLRGHLLCPRCGSVLTGSGSTGGSGKTYYYYHCQHGCKERFRADSANDLVVEFFDSININNTIQDIYIQMCKSIFKEESRSRKNDSKIIAKQIKEKKERLDKVDDMYIDGDFDKESYTRKKSKLLDEIAILEQNAYANKPKINNMDYMVKNSLNILTNLSNVWDKADLETKDLIISSIIPEKLIFENKNYRTGNTDRLLSLLCSDSNGFGVNKKKTNQKNSDLSRIVPPPRLELGSSV